MLDQRRQLLRAAVGFARYSMHSYDRALWALRSWLDSWPGIGHVTVGMHRQGFDLQLTQYDERGWRATFYTTGMEHSPTSATGTAWEPTSWRATQWAACDALGRTPPDASRAEREVRVLRLHALRCGRRRTRRGSNGPSLVGPFRRVEIDVAEHWSMWLGTFKMEAFETRTSPCTRQFHHRRPRSSTARI